VESWLSWQGDFTTTDFTEDAPVWERVGAEPIEIVLPDATYLTVRGEIVADVEGDETEVAFIGGEDSVAVFTDVADLARYCRTATEHRLVRAEFWGELADVEDDEAFRPEVSYDLRKPSEAGGVLLRELAQFCRLEADLAVLDAPTVDRDDWRELLAEVQTCLEPQD
jgi:hypothetical protein